MWLLCIYTTCSVIICSFEPMIDPYYFGRLYLYYLSDHYRSTLLLCPQRFITLQIISLYCSFDERLTRTTLFDLYSILLIICHYNILILQMYILCLYRLINCLIAINYFIYVTWKISYIIIYEQLGNHVCAICLTCLIVKYDFNIFLTNDWSILLVWQWLIYLSFFDKWLTFITCP